MVDRGRSQFERRRLLRGLGTGAVAGFAGCLGSDDGTDGDDGSEADSLEPEPVDVAADATWRTATLEDATTGEEFRIDAFDRPVLVHTFAIGCAVCAAQHDEFAALYGSADVEIVDLTTDPYESQAAVRTHAEEEGFDWRFGVTPDEVIGSLTQDFGAEVTSSASSPVILTCPGGETYRLEKKVDAAELETVLEEHC